MARSRTDQVHRRSWNILKFVRERTHYVDQKSVQKMLILLINVSERKYFFLLSTLVRSEFRKRSAFEQIAPVLLGKRIYKDVVTDYSHKSLKIRISK